MRRALDLAAEAAAAGEVPVGAVVTLGDEIVAETRNAMRGSLEKALEAYDALAKKYPQSFLGEKAAKRATEIRDRRSQMEGFYLSLSKVQGKTETPPAPASPAPIFPTPAPILPAPELPKAESPKGDLPKAPEAGKTGEPKS